MYADDFDDKEKARMEKQADKKKTGEEAVGVSRMEGEGPEIERATGNGSVGTPKSSSLEENKGNGFAVTDKGRTFITSRAINVHHVRLWNWHNLFYSNI
jgi:hypothetical protein